MGKLILNKSKIVINTKVILALTPQNLEKFKNEFVSIEVYNDFIKRFSAQKELEFFVYEVNEENRYYIVYEEYLFRLFLPRPNLNKALYVAFITKRTNEQNKLIHSHNYTLYTKKLVLHIANNMPIVILSEGKNCTEDVNMTVSNVERIFKDLDDVLTEINTRDLDDKTNSEKLQEFISQANNINDLEKEVEMNCNLYYTKLKSLKDKKYTFYCSKLEKLPKVNETVYVENLKGKIVNVEVDTELCIDVEFDETVKKLPEPGSIIREYDEFEYIIKKELIEKIENEKTPFTNMINDPVFEELIYSDKFEAEIKELNQYTYDLNEYQDNALLQAALIEDNGLLIYGGPTSGKTTVVNNLIKHLIANKKRVLLSSSNYKEINNVLNHLDNPKNTVCISYDKNSDYSYDTAFDKYRTKIEETIQGKCVSVYRDIEKFEELVKKREELENKIETVDSQNESLTKKKFHAKELTVYYTLYNELHRSKGILQKIIDDFDVLCEEHITNMASFKFKINFVYRIKTRSKKSKYRSNYKKEYAKYQSNLKKYKKVYLKFEEKFKENSRKNVNSLSTLTSFKEEYNYQIDELSSNYIASSFIQNFFQTKQNIIFDEEHLTCLKDYYELLCEYKNQILEKKVDLSDSFIKSINVLGVTPKDLLNEQFKNQTNDVVILLDAQTVLPLDGMVALSKATQKVVIIGGGIGQPTSLLRDKSLLTKYSVKEEFLDTSIFDMIYNSTNKQSVAVLKQSYNMTSSVNSVLSKYLYNNEIVVVNEEENPLKDLESTFVLYDTCNCEKRYETKKDGSLYNKLEVAFVTDVLLPMVGTDVEILSRKNYLNIVAAYDVQATQIINSLVKKKIMTLEDAKKIVKTLDTFEECENLIFSLVRSHKKDKHGYVHNSSRIINTLAKASKQVICLGDMNFITSIEGVDKETEIFVNVMKYINETAEQNTTDQNVVCKKLVVLEDGK